MLLHLELPLSLHTDSENLMLLAHSALLYISLPSRVDSLPVACWNVLVLYVVLPWKDVLLDHKWGAVCSVGSLAILISRLLDCEHGVVRLVLLVGGLLGEFKRLEARGKGLLGVHRYGRWWWVEGLKVVVKDVIWEGKCVRWLLVEMTHFDHLLWSAASDGVAEFIGLGPLALLLVSFKLRYSV